MADVENRRLRWWAIIVVTLVGLGITLSPFALAHRVDDAYGSAESLISAVLTNVGSAVLLVALFFVLERGLETRVRAAAERGANAAVDRRTQELETANRELGVRLDALQSQLDDKVAAEDSRRTSTVDRLDTEISFDTVAEALEQANDLRALADGDITVPAGHALNSALVRVSWRAHSSSTRPPHMSSFWDESEEGEPRMTLRYEAQYSPDGTPGLPVVEVVWPPRESPVVVLHALRDEMRRRGFVEEAKVVGDHLFANLRTAVSAALAARTGAEKAWAHGAMYEWIADGWAVTDRGLVTRDHGVVASEEFPQKNQVRPMGTVPKRFSKPAPDDVDDSLWTYAIERATRYHPRGGWLGAGTPVPLAYTPDTSPRKNPNWPPA